jgi:cold shock CspA family protein
MTGVIKTVNYERGFGFITGLDGIDYFFHRSALTDELVFGGLQEGDEVELLVLANTAKGWRANSVAVTAPAPS